MKSKTAIQLAKYSLSAAIFALLAFISSCASNNSSEKVEAQTAKTTTSSFIAKKPASPVNSTKANVSAEVALANHLKQKGAKMYATFWCQVCNWQERQFGAEASKIIKANIRIECDPRGKNPQTELCERTNIRALPTWQINGKLYEGGMRLTEIADISGYTGPRNFKASGN